ncbi:hypothetical protein D9623_22575 [Azospirillum brasilense]|uniref:Uncharacterized protein n=1 Tax=Azospirillum brasilense TaxID=192 RepID=A0A0P0EQJ9_AZOBR|nr:MULTISPECIES: hypothetical protein [Azospirillum]ALJ38345.1 hypothetical protein AMK58_22855 [Azospirillum brasilense]MDW7554300.1 hypothetical protein [Azospirillum brasilense]MDW7594517.1 hypothetical protein [Azospirillum brasilense]MDW7629371.1 hypothetical protein [Azospirillum brasilense]MDW7629975.1 hypothetical protein [Azospirillum brasilense]
MPKVRTVSEHGSFRLVERGGCYAVIEARDGQIYGLHGEAGDRPSAPDRPDAAEAVVAPGDWNVEDVARRRFEELTARGEELARKIW